MTLRWPSLALALSLWAPSCARAPEGPVERGRATFLRTCSGCHGVGGTGGVPTPAFNQPATPPRNLTDPEFQASHTDEQLMFVVKNGKGNMPAFGVLLTDEQMREVVAFVRTLGKPKP